MWQRGTRYGVIGLLLLAMGVMAGPVAAGEPVGAAAKTCWFTLDTFGMPAPERITRMVLRYQSVYDGTGLWALGSSSVAGGYPVYRVQSDEYGDSYWVPAGGGAVDVAVTPDGVAWIVDNQNRIHRWTGSGWQELPGRGRGIAAGMDGSVWLTGTAEVPGAFGWQLYRWNGSGWTLVSGAAVHLEVDYTGQPWVTVVPPAFYETRIYHRVGESWQLAPNLGFVLDLAVGGYALGPDKVWVLSTYPNGSTSFSRWTGTGWQSMGDGAGAIGLSIDNVGNVYRLNGDGRIYSWGCG